MKFNHFRHSVDADDDSKLREFSKLLGRRSKEAYHYYFRTLELCAKNSDDGQTEFTFHVQTLRLKWETTTQNVQEVCDLLTQSALIGCRVVTNHVVLSVPNLPKYLGSYVTNERKVKEKKGKENNNKANSEEPKKILPSVTPQEILKKPSPLSVYFSDAPEIQKWLNAGIHETHMMLLKKYSHHEVVALIQQAYEWSLKKHAKDGIMPDAGAWLYTFVSSKDIKTYGQGKKTSPQGNPYLKELKDKYGQGEPA